MNPDLQTLSSAISSAKSILILISQNPSLDAAASALSLALILNRQGKSANVICPSPMTAGLSRLVGVDKISDQVGNKNLVISFNLPEEAIEKISYNYDGGKLNVVIEPSGGFTAPTKDKVNFAYSGIEADLLIYIGVNSDTDLGKLASSPELANHPNQQYLGADSLAGFGFGVAPRPVYSQVACLLISDLGFELDLDSANNLMLGLDSATKNLTVGITADVLEAAAKCLRAGAVRQLGELQAKPNQFVQAMQNLASPATFRPQLPRRKNLSGPKPNFPQPKPLTQPNQPQPQPQTQSPNQPRPNLPTNQSKAEGEQDLESPIDPSPDWFEPKIYKGSSLI